MADVLWSKDTITKLENVRFYLRTDKVFASIDNRPIHDLNQRDLDLNRFFTPARGLRAREQSPISASVDIEAGWFLVGGVTPTFYAGGTIGPIPATSAPGTFRKDLIYFDIASASPVRVTGSEAASFILAVAPPIPANSGAVPLSHVYVDNTPTPFSEQVLINVAGFIRDIRSAAGVMPWAFDTTLANLNTDAPGGALGTLYTLPRTDHQHPLNVDGSNPVTIAPDNAADPGTNDTYARVDHVHDLSLPPDATVLKKDTGSGAVGVQDSVPRSDHQHPLNVDATVPATVSRTTAVVGTADTYARRDHVHNLPTSLIQAISLTSFAGNGAVVGPFTATQVVGGCSVTIPANTFPNGIVMIATAELSVSRTSDFHVAVALEAIANQGATFKRFASDPVTPAQLPGGSGLANLAGTPMVLYDRDGSAAIVLLSATVVSVAAWVKAGVPQLFGNGGGLDWNPAIATTIDFGSAFINAAGIGSAKVGVRSIMCFGF